MSSATVGDHLPKERLVGVPSVFPSLPEISSNDPQGEVKRIQYQALVESKKAQDAADLERERAGWANEYAHRQAVQNAYLEVAKGGLDRAKARAEFVEKAAATIGVAYAALVGLSYKIDASSSHPLPARGIVPAMFLGAAIVFAAVYHAYVLKLKRVPGSEGKPSLQEAQAERLSAFIHWVNVGVYQRKYALQVSLFCLGWGVVFLPIAYLNWSDTLVAGFAGGAAIIALVAPWLIGRYSERKDEDEDRMTEKRIPHSR